MRGDLTGNRAGENTTKNNSPGMKGVLMMNEEGLNSSGGLADAGTGNGCVGIPGCHRGSRDVEETRKNPGRIQELGGSWESREEREKHKCGLKTNKRQNAEPKNL